MARLFNARLLVIATFVLILVSFFGIRSLMAEGKSEAVKTETAKRAQSWYYTGSTTNPDFNNPDNYSSEQPEGVECGGESPIICSIQDVADSNGDKPAMSHGDVTSDSSNQYAKTFRQL